MACDANTASKIRSPPTPAGRPTSNSPLTQERLFVLVLILDAKGQVVLSVRSRPRHQDAHPYAEVVRCLNSTFGYP